MKAKLSLNKRADTGKASVLRVAYLVALGAVMPIGWLALSGRTLSLMGLDQARLPLLFQWSLVFINVVNSFAFVTLVAVFLYLAYEPRWWGKLLCLFLAVPWIGFSAMGLSLCKDYSGLSFIPGAAGLVMLLVAVTHQMIKPGFK